MAKQESPAPQGEIPPNTTRDISSRIERLRLLRGSTEERSDQGGVWEEAAFNDIWIEFGER